MIAALQALLTKLVEGFSKLIKTIKEFFEELWDEFEEYLDWILELLDWVPKKLWKELLDSVASLLEAIPVPDFFANLDGAGLSAQMLWGIDALAIPQGLAIVGTSYLIRFAIRRIPIIG